MSLARATLALYQRSCMSVRVSVTNRSFVKKDGLIELFDTGPFFDLFLHCVKSSGIFEIRALPSGSLSQTLNLLYL